MIKTPNLWLSSQLQSQKVKTFRSQNCTIFLKNSQKCDWVTQPAIHLSNPRWWSSHPASLSHAHWQTVALRNLEFCIRHRNFPHWLEEERVGCSPQKEPHGATRRAPPEALQVRQVSLSALTRVSCFEKPFSLAFCLFGRPVSSLTR